MASSVYRNVVPFLLAAISSTLALQVVDDSQCDCYLTDGNYPTYYKNHGFWDFRSLSEFAGVPPVIQTIEGNANAGFTSTYFDWDSEFAQFWGPQNWNNGVEGFSMQNSYNNLYIEENPDGNSDTFMTMRTARLPDFQTAAEIESIQLVNHASLRMLAKTTGSPGACTSIFTYLGSEDSQQVQEADIEILTRDPDTAIHYTNQPGVDNEGNEIPGASSNVTLPNGVKWSDWVTHRLDWTPGRTTYLANGVQTHTQTLQAPRDPSIIDLNSWSSGDESQYSWTGRMPLNGEARQQVQYIELLYNVVSQSSCGTICSIDKTSIVGQPVLL